MGITIFASGKIDRIEDIPRLIDELKGIAEEHKWAYHIIDDDFDVQPNAILTRRDQLNSAAVIEGSLGLKGIVLNVDPGAEPFSILFDRSGALTDMLQQISWIESTEQNIRFTMCKTQFGSIDSHIRIIEILDFLKRTYIADLTANDEGAYWESRDRRILAGKRITLDYYMRHAERVIGSIELSSGDVQDAETIASRIEECFTESREGRRITSLRV